MPNLIPYNLFLKTISTSAIKETLEKVFFLRRIFEANFQQSSKTNMMTNTDRSLAQLAEVVKMRLEESNIIAKSDTNSSAGENQRHIVWITHSMGGLILKYLLLGDARFAKSTRAIVFLGVPHFGSPISEEFQYLSRFAPLYCQELHPTWFKYSFCTLNERFTQLCLKHNIVILSMAETVETPLPYVSKILSSYKRHIVPPPFANLEYGVFFMLPDIDHQRICYVSRPDDRISLMKQLIKLSTKKSVT
ncbi:protein SERAC1-like [Hylaeus volcanicus]|uniref:protein SERAC1-like n=1 Tax=Hylaeus volcanicus TaxID=313075 RepID=UPI0023B7BE73|nr:protein SERAC1-like [Hylaeus volcanicus]